jgi:uncharacterized protein
MAAGEPFEFTADDGTRLRGTVTRPTSTDPAPAALLLSGAGPLDRDSNMPGQLLNVSSALAAALAERGVASLRYDKRGVGESEGEYLTTSFERETGDASAALSALGDAQGVDPERLVLVGHSVGATIAIRLAARTDRVVGLVLLSAACRSGAEVMEEQTRRIAGSLRGPSRLLSRPFQWKQAQVRNRLLRSTKDVVRVGRERLAARWFREFMAFDPAPDLQGISCPVLAITGDSDLQVDADDVARIGRLVPGPFTGYTPGALTHVLREHVGPPSLGSYPAQLKQPVDARLVEQVVAWTAARALE